MAVRISTQIKKFAGKISVHEHDYSLLRKVTEHN